MKRVCVIVAVMVAVWGCVVAGDRVPVDGAGALAGLMERIDVGLSGKVVVRLDDTGGSEDYFVLEQDGWRPMITANNAVSAAVGLNHYLKYTAGVHLSWNRLRAELPDTLPPVRERVRMSTDMRMRYYLNYCTHSYSMAFWDWERWEREIDWMALHGINMPLAITGAGVLWRNVLRRLGYPEDRIDDYVAGPAFQAWWLMNNLEGWGGRNTDEYYAREEALQKRITGRMREFGIEPVLPGYSGMVPHDSRETLGLDVANPGLWLGYERPAFLQPTDKDFGRVAAVYYDELNRLYGVSRYYSMDPFHEGGNTDGVDLQAAGASIMRAMKANNEDAVWVIQSWQGNPRAEMIDSLAAGDVVVLDLQAENRGEWNHRRGGFGHHDWLYCMLLNFGGNVGMYGKLPGTVSGYAMAEDRSSTLKGIGLTMEGIENNPVMYELMCELPWRGGAGVDTDGWLLGYVRARYGGSNAAVDEAWRLLGRSVYGCPDSVVQQGCAESVFCARPSDSPRQASTWANTVEYYDYRDVVRAAELMSKGADEFAGNPNYVYDMVDVTRQAVADVGRRVGRELSLASERGDKAVYASAADKFLRLMDMQDSLLGTVADFRLGRWTEMARGCASAPEEKDRWEWNARVQITTWGNRAASDGGGLHDYAHREWQGLIRDFYKPRWQRWFDERLGKWDSGLMPEIDFYAMEEAWTLRHNSYSAAPEGDPVEMVRRVLAELAGIAVID